MAHFGANNLSRADHLLEIFTSHTDTIFLQNNYLTVHQYAPRPIRVPRADVSELT